MAVELSLKHPANVEDPFPLFRYLREEEPVRWSPETRGWLVTRYEDVFAILQQPLLYSSDRFRKIRPEFASTRPAVMDVAKVLRDWMVLRDPPDHTRLRRLLHNNFTPGQLERMRPAIQGIIDHLFDKVEAEGRMEFVEDFAFPLPAAVIAILLGIPQEDIEQIKAWSDGLAAYIGGDQSVSDNMEIARRGVLDMCDYFRQLVASHRAEPKEDLISIMVRGEDEEGKLTDEELVSNCVLLLFAGHETTTNLLGNGLFHLLRNPDQYKLLAENPSLAPAAVEEFLRYDASVPAVIKVMTEDVTLHGQTMTKGEMVIPFLSSANRDPQRFENADILSIMRKDNRHLSFAFGIHFCLGAPLARMEAQMAFATLFRRFEALTLLNENPRWLPQIFLRGLAELPIGFRGRAGGRAVGA